MNRRIFIIISFILIVLIIVLVRTNNFDKIENIKLFLDTESFIVYEIEFPFKSYSSVDLNDNYIYATVDSNNDSFYDKFIKYNIENGKYEVLYISEFKEAALQNVMVNDNWVIWLDTNMQLNKTKIYCMNRKTGEEILVYKEDSKYTNMDTPYLYKNYISWVGIDNNIAKVFVYNLGNKELKEVYNLNHCSFYNTFVHINENKLLWTDNTNGKGYYLTLDLETKNIKKYPAEFQFPGYAKIANNKIFSINFNDYHNWVEQDFGCFDINTGKYKTIEGNKYINSLKLFDNTLAVINNESQLILYDVSCETKRHPVNINKTVEKIVFSAKGELIFTARDKDKSINMFVVKSKSR